MSRQSFVVFAELQQKRLSHIRIKLIQGNHALRF